MHFPKTHINLGKHICISENPYIQFVYLLFIDWVLAIFSLEYTLYSLTLVYYDTKLDSHSSKVYFSFFLCSFILITPDSINIIL